MTESTATTPGETLEEAQAAINRINAAREHLEDFIANPEKYLEPIPGTNKHRLRLKLTHPGGPEEEMKMAECLRDLITLLAKARGVDAPDMIVRESELEAPR